MVAAANLPGCAILEHEIDAPLPAESIDAFAEGSHYSEVLGRLGPPTKMSALPHGMAFLYEHVTLTERQYGLILPREIGKWIKAVYASADADIEAVLFIFDARGILRGADRQTWSADAGAGISVTLIFSAGSFTDTEQYESSASRSLDWGQKLLSSPLVVLNSGQDLESGGNGIQLTTNSKGIGQDTLELGSD